MCLNEGLPLADEGSKLVRCEVHAVKVSEASSARDFLDSQAELPEGLLIVLVEVGEGLLDNSSLECIVGVLETLRSVDEGFTNVSVLEENGGLDVIPVFAGEGVDCALLLAATLSELLVFADSCW